MIKGFLIDELLRLPMYWKKVWSISTSELRISKHKSGNQRRQYYLKIQGPESHLEKVAIYLHGGGWLFGTPEKFVQNAMVFTRKGYTVYMPSYRRLPAYDFRDMYDDLKKSIKHISDNNTKSVDQLIIAGMSAGAHLGAILAMDSKIDWRVVMNSVAPKAFIGIGAPLDLRKMWQSPVIKILTRKDYDRSNPISYLRSDSPQMLSLSAGKDGIVYHASQRSFEKLAKELKVPIRICHHPKCTHMEIAGWSIEGTAFWQDVDDFLKKID